MLKILKFVGLIFLKGLSVYLEQYVKRKTF